MFDNSLFNSIYSRTDTGAIKYNNLPPNTIHMWIADMGFKSPPAVTDALTKAAYKYGE